MLCNYCIVTLLLNLLGCVLGSHLFPCPTPFLVQEIDLHAKERLTLMLF